MDINAFISTILDYVPIMSISLPIALSTIRFWRSKNKLMTTSQSTLGMEAELPPPHLFDQTSNLDIFEIDYRNRKTNLTKKELNQLAKEGYVLLRNVLKSDEIHFCLQTISKICREENEEFNALAEQCIDLVKNGEIDMANGGLNHILQFEPQAKGREKGDRAEFVRKIGGYHEHFPELALQELPVLKSLVCQIVESPETEVFQSLALLKPPVFGREKPFHQDHSYFNVRMEACANGLPTRIIGIWAALDPATAENGCMHVIPRAHCGGPWKHFMVRDWQICDSAISNVLQVPMNSGDCLLFSSLLPHGTPPNLSLNSRRALQFHLVPKNYPRTKSTRVETFGGDFAGLQC